MNNTELVALVLFFIGIFGILTQKNMIKTIMCICIAEAAVVLFFLSINHMDGATPPIGTLLQTPADPFVQALMITAIVIGIAVTAYAVSMFIGLYHKYGTTQWDKVQKAQKEEDGHS